MNEWTGVAGALCLTSLVGASLILLPGRTASARQPLRFAPLQRLSNLLAQAGWSHTAPQVVLALWLIAAFFAAAVVGALVPIGALVPLTFLAVLFGGRNLLFSRIQARRRRLRSSWPGIVDSMRQVIRSGGSIPEAVTEAGMLAPDELRGAFDGFPAALDSGHRVDEALRQLKSAIADPVADRVIEALRMAYEVGGAELPAVLQALQHSVRSDIAAREDALAKQAWIRAASRMGVAAPWLVLLLLSGRPETISAYSTPAGSLIIFSGAALGAIAFRMMSRLGRLPIEQRWFAGSSSVPT